MKQTARLLSLDVLRGITVAGMILVNTPGSWGTVYAPLCHASWNGLTPTDLVFPFFMFIMGVSMYFSLRKFDFTFSWPLLAKVLKRAVVIFIIGVAIAWFSQWLGALCNVRDSELSAWERFSSSVFSFGHLRILGVLQRLAIAYLGGALLSLWLKPRHYLLASAIILFVYFLILLWGDGFVLSENNIIARVDTALFGAEHLYGDYMSDGTYIAFDPEGLLSALSSFAHVLLGMFVGNMLVKIKENEIRVMRLFIYGTILVFAACLLSYGCPINKKVWSPTYVMITCGFASQLLALLIYCIDIRGWQRWGRFFEAFGVNPLFMYVLSEVLAIALGYISFPWGNGYISIQRYVYSQCLASWINPYGASLVYAMLFVLLNWVVAHMLYKRKIYIKL